MHGIHSNGCSWRLQFENRIIVDEKVLDIQELSEQQYGLQEGVSLEEEGGGAVRFRCRAFQTSRDEN